MVCLARQQLAMGGGLWLRGLYNAHSCCPELERFLGQTWVTQEPSQPPAGDRGVVMLIPFSDPFAHCPSCSLVSPQALWICSCLSVAPDLWPQLCPLRNSDSGPMHLSEHSVWSWGSLVLGLQLAVSDPPVLASPAEIPREQKVEEERIKFSQGKVIPNRLLFLPVCLVPYVTSASQ